MKIIASDIKPRKARPLKRRLPWPGDKNWRCLLLFALSRIRTFYDKAIQKFRKGACYKMTKRISSRTPFPEFDGCKCHLKNLITSLSCVIVTSYPSILLAFSWDLSAIVDTKILSKQQQQKKLQLGVSRLHSLLRNGFGCLKQTILFSFPQNAFPQL